MAKLTLLDLAKRSGSDGIQGVVESMTQMNGLLTMIPMRQTTQAMFKYKQRMSLPSLDFRMLNAGVTPEKSVIRDVIVECKDILGVSEVDKKLAERYPQGVNAFRAMEDAGFVAAGSNKFNSKLYYGNSATTAAEIDGIGTILGTLGGTCISATGNTASVQTSMYFWSFSDATGANGRLPGVEVPYFGELPMVSDMGLQMVYETGSSTKKYPAYTSIFEFSPAFAVYDVRSVGRLCNIQAAALAAPPTVALINQVITAMAPYQVDLITCNKATYNSIQTLKGTTFTNSEPYASSDIFKRAKYFDNIPIIIDENITSTEAVVS